MRLTIAAIGRLKQGPERDLAERYRERAAKAGRALGFRAVEVVELDESRARDASARATDESERILSTIPAGSVLVLLDETGESLSSEVLAKRLARWRDAGRTDLTLVIGGPDGHADPLHRRADLMLAFGRATWPHQLVRIMVLEQVYRAVTILSGHPYHRA